MPPSACANLAACWMVLAPLRWIVCLSTCGWISGHAPREPVTCSQGWRLATSSRLTGATWTFFAEKPWSNMEKSFPATPEVHASKRDPESRSAALREASAIAAA
eukprot:CAMPEP_0115763344 /NCGR_PEP_ID=MMETSP0272-20121206/101489_1 /TAXON_ID=71861 /ORGANISM="Scrippsiella trochoidea, Strain CCMP3099" /LENGTH=103 /DNA_ID=CAMNT_0003209083 /DNA_START=494 /DNA_END=801 /DNA_ORIENTATION=+